LLVTNEIVSDFEVSLIQGDESGVVSAYQAILEDLKSPDPSSRALAISAVTQDPPRFLEKVVLGLADDSQTAGASIRGLKRLATPPAKAKLAQLAGAANPEWLRQDAITALGELGDPSYCRLMLEFAQSSTEYSGLIALRAAGLTCEKEALPTLLALLPNANSTLRYEVAYALGNTHTREAVSPLISLLADADENVRRAAAEALATLTHRTPTEDIRNKASARQAYLDWLRWWSLNKGTAPIYSARQCDGSRPID
jgi:HEAT repeat protein